MTKIKDIVIGIGAGILILGGLVWLTKPSAPESVSGKTDSPLAGPNALRAEESFFDFGRVSMAAGNVNHLFKIRNGGAEPIEIKKMYTSCMCTTASLVRGAKRFGPYGMPGHGFIPSIKESLAPGEEATVEAIFDPAAHGPAGVGPIERAIRIETDSGQPFDLAFKAMVTP